MAKVRRNQGNPRQTRVNPGDRTSAESAHAMEEVAVWCDAVRRQALTRLARKPPEPFRRLRYVALVLAVAAHLGMLWSLRNAMRMPPLQTQSRIEVILLNDAPAPPPLPVPPPLRRPRAKQSVPMSTVAMAPASSAATPSAAPDFAALPPLFNRDGSIRLPPQAHFVTPLDAGVARGRELMTRGHNMIHCRRSRFDPSPTAEEAGNQAGKAARMAQLIMGNPLDPLATVGNRQDVGTAIELAAAGRALEEQACDDTLWNPRWESPAERSARRRQRPAPTEALQQAQQFRH